MKIYLGLFGGLLASSIAIGQGKEAPPTQLKSLEFNDMNDEISPKEDFYEFSCGKWRSENPIPESESRWSSFNVLGEKNNNVLNGILEKASTNPGAKGSAQQLVGDYYNSFMDTTTRNKNGLDPIRADIAAIETLSSKTDVLDLVMKHHSEGFRSLFSAGVEQDMKINTKYTIYIGQGGMGLSNRDYYFNEDDRSKKIRDEYQKFMTKLQVASGLADQKTAEKNTGIVFGIEKEMAAKSMSPVERRNMEAQYNKHTFAELNDMCGNVDWAKYFEGRGMGKVDTVIVSQPDFLVRIDSLLGVTSVEDWQAYLKWKVLNGSAGMLTMEMDRINFGFYSGVMRGTKKQKPMWKRGIQGVTYSALSEALGQAFVEQNFSPEAKRKVDEMVDNIMLVFKDRIDNLDWMSAETKVKAQEKLASFVRKLGFPDEWKDYSSLDIVGNNYAKNVRNSDKFEINENIAKLGKDIDKSEWGMAPHIINAYYNPLLNEIVFPAGIMQAPFFSEDYEDAVNYARMGAVIGHELTHGFDDMGSQFDAAGRMQNWWTEEDKVKFEERTQKLVDQFNAFEVLEGVFVNGKLTLGENIADLGGLTIAYHAYQKSLEGKPRPEINGYTCEQRFFIAFGQIWKNNIRDKALMTRVATDPHSPGKYRVNGTLSNMPEFFEAFGVKEKDAMRQPADKIAKIW